MNNYASRISQIRESFCDGNNKLFAQKLGIKPGQASGLCCGSVSLGKKTADRILEAFPQVSRSWLLLGDGEMKTEDTIKKSDTAHVESYDPEPKDVTIPASVWKVIQQQSDSLAVKDRQITKLIGLIEKKMEVMDVVPPLESMSVLEEV